MAQISIKRQAQFIEAIACLVGVLLGMSFSPWFYLLPAVIGIILLVASLNEECLMEKLLAKCSWNK